MKIRLLISLLFFGILTACGGGGGGSSATDTSATNPSSGQQVSIRQLADLASTAQNANLISTDEADDFSSIKRQLEGIAGRSLADSEVDAVLALLNVRLTEEYCGQRSQVLSADGRSCQAPEPTCNLQHRISPGVSYWTCGYSAADCESAGKVLDSFKVGVCVAPTEAQCRERGQERKGEGINAVCEASIASCNAADKIYKNGNCEDCSGDTPIRHGNACGVNAEICASRNQVLQGFVCVALTDRYCRDRNQRLNKDSTSCRYVTADECKADGMALNDARTACRALVAADCVPLNQVFDAGQCRARTQSDCTPLNQKLDAVTNNCRAWTAADCATTEIFENNNCRALVVADCNANNKVLSGGVCVACSGSTPARYDNVCGPTAQQCQSRGQVLHGAVCVSPTDGQCRKNNQRLNDRGDACRALVASDCSQVQVFENGACRLRIAGDCSATEEFDNGICRARVASDCSQVQVFENGVCRLRIAGDCLATEKFDNGICRALTAEDCAAQTPPVGVNILGEDGTCRRQWEADCAANQQWSPFTHRCVARQQTCTGTQVPDGNGGCRAPVVAADCYANNQIFKNGSCQSCTGDTPFRHGNTCVAFCPGEGAEQSRYKSRTGGKCEPTIAVGWDSKPTPTTIEACNAKNQIAVAGNCQSCDLNTIRVYNTCQKCPVGKQPNSDRSACVASKCPFNLSRSLNGECSLTKEQCSRYDNRAVYDEQDGSCNLCPVGSHPNSDKTECIEREPLNFLLASKVAKEKAEENGAVFCWTSNRGWHRLYYHFVCDDILRQVDENGNGINDTDENGNGIIDVNECLEGHTQGEEFLSWNKEKYDEAVRFTLRWWCLGLAHWVIQTAPAPPARSSTSERFTDSLSNDPVHAANSFLQVNSTDPIRVNWSGMEINISPYYSYNKDSKSEHVSFSALRHFGNDIAAYTGLTTGKDKDLYLLGVDWRDYRFMTRNHDEHEVQIYSIGYSTQINQSEYKVGFEHGSDNLTSGHFMWNYRF